MTVPSAYTDRTQTPRETSEQLRARIPGWGVDLDPKDRPSVPRLQPHDDLKRTTDAYRSAGSPEATICWA